MKLEFIKKYKNLLLFLLLICIYLSFSVEIIKQPFIFAEDTIFLNDALKEGFRSVFNRHAYYLEIISRMTAIISIYIGRLVNSYWMATFGMRLISTVLGAYFVFYFTLEDFSWLVKKKSIRFFLSVVMLVWMGNFYNMFYNITCIHWYGELFAFWIGLNLMHGKFPKVRDCILYIFVCLNSPEGCIAVLPMCIYLIYNLKQKKKIRLYEVIMLGFGLVSCLIQLYCLGQNEMGNISETIFSLKNLWTILKHAIASSAQVSTLILGNAFANLFSMYVQIGLGVLIWFILLYFLRKLQRDRFLLLYLVLFTFIHYVIILVKGNWEKLPDLDNWIHAVPATVFVTIVFVLVINNVNVHRKSVTGYILVIFLMISFIGELNDAGKIDGLGGHYKYYDYTMLGMDKLTEIEDRVDFSSNQYEYLQLYADWKVMIPVSEKTVK